MAINMSDIQKFRRTWWIYDYTKQLYIDDLEFPTNGKDADPVIVHYVSEDNIKSSEYYKSSLDYRKYCDSNQLKFEYWDKRT